MAVKNETGCGDIPLGYPSIDTDSSNSVHISYSQYYNTAAKYVIRYAKSTNYTSFSKSNLVEDTGINFYQSSLIVDSADKIYVAALDDTNRDLFWAHYNGSTWSTTNNLTNGSFDIESAVVGAKMGGGITDHILLSKVYDASSNKKVIYWRWEYSSSNWSKYSEELDTGNEGRSFVTIEKHAPSGGEGQ